MALKDSKANIQKQETKDEPQTNGSYKSRKIIIKIMENIHIHPWTKWKQSSKNKVQYIDSANKGNKKLYLPIKKNKANLSTNWKTKLKQGAKWRIKQWKQNCQICWEEKKERKERICKVE